MIIHTNHVSFFVFVHIVYVCPFEIRWRELIIIKKKDGKFTIITWLSFFRCNGMF